NPARGRMRRGIRRCFAGVAASGEEREVRRLVAGCCYCRHQKLWRFSTGSVAMVTRVSPEISEGVSGNWFGCGGLTGEERDPAALRRCRCLRRRKMEILVVRQCCFAGEGEQTRE
ncbi:hypothetical protein HAX54_001656, partial [Datura stramonium]|nr:hypothetical protein [Datura stramonium]